MTNPHNIDLDDLQVMIYNIILTAGTAPGSPEQHADQAARAITKLVSILAQKPNI